jgi:arsenate reductase
MTPRHFNVLFLCIGNSARSIMAEAIMNRKGFPNFTGYSAGSHPTGHVNPQALKQIDSAGLPVEGLRSKSWDEFGKRGAPEIHFVFTVCDREVAEPCPVWPGQPLTAQWNVPDPAAVTGSDDRIQRAYFEAWRILDRRIGLFVSLPLETLEREVVQREIDKIGRS